MSERETYIWGGHGGDHGIDEPSILSCKTNRRTFYYWTDAPHTQCFMRKGKWVRRGDGLRSVRAQAVYRQKAGTISAQRGLSLALEPL